MYQVWNILKSAYVKIVVHIFCFFPVSLRKRRILKNSLNFCEILLRIRFIFGGTCIYEKKTGLFSESRVKVGIFVFTEFILLSFVYINKKGRNYPFTDNSDHVTQANAVTWPKSNLTSHSNRAARVLWISNNWLSSKIFDKIALILTTDNIIFITKHY